MKKVAGKTRATLEELRKMKGKSNFALLYKQQKEEKSKPKSED
ncbi:hypothetical protein [Rheinheimera sp. MMS21-TC3]|nr:hypothetical protein [Rheinheimera sp. MMS21-TC3]WNO61604.1 hypothetical protein RDV63_11805 [Rheinheimera sp. MMS21-TC3]|tara:strand:- start:763 stop:891 length:129 start_codon:yes stop_codon:yes gene_type:complete